MTTAATYGPVGAAAAIGAGYAAASSTPQVPQPRPDSLSAPSVPRPKPTPPSNTTDNASSGGGESLLDAFTAGVSSAYDTFVDFIAGSDGPGGTEDSRRSIFEKAGDAVSDVIQPALGDLRNNVLIPIGLAAIAAAAVYVIVKKKG